MNRSSNRALLQCALRATNEAKLVAIKEVLTNIEGHIDKQNTEPTRRILARLIATLEADPVFTPQAAPLRVRLRALKSPESKKHRHWPISKAERKRLKAESLKAQEAQDAADALESLRETHPQYIPMIDAGAQAEVWRRVRAETDAAALSAPDTTSGITSHSESERQTAIEEAQRRNTDPPPWVTKPVYIKDAPKYIDARPVTLPVIQPVIQTPVTPANQLCKWCMAFGACTPVAGEGPLCSYCADVWRQREMNPTPQPPQALVLRPIQRAPLHAILPTPPKRQEQQRRADREAQESEQRRQQAKAERESKIKNIQNLDFETQRKLLGL